MKINQIVLAIAILVIFFGPIGISKAAGAWQTTGGGGEHQSAEQGDSGHEMGGMRDGPGQGRGRDLLISGRTTFKQIISQGVSKEDIEAAIKMKIPDTSKVIRDFCDENKLAFHDVKASIEQLVAAIKK